MSRRQLGDRMRAHQCRTPIRDVRAGRTVANGLLKNFNTIEDFKKADKQGLFNEFSEKVLGGSSCLDSCAR